MPAAPVITTLNNTDELVVPATVTVWPTCKIVLEALQTKVPAAPVEYTLLKAVAVVAPLTVTVCPTAKFDVPSQIKVPANPVA